MSRSVRKKPYRKVKSHFSQKMAARRCRRLKLILPDGCKYKRYYPQWDVVDYHWGDSFRDCLNNGWYKSLHPVRVEKYKVSRLTFTPSDDGDIIAEVYSYINRNNPKFIGKERFEAKFSEREVVTEHYSEISFKKATEEEIRHYYIKWKKEVLGK